MDPREVTEHPRRRSGAVESRLTARVASPGPVANAGPAFPRFLSVKQAAELMGVADVTLYRAIWAGEFPAVKIRGRYVIPTRAIDALEQAALAAPEALLEESAAAWTAAAEDVAS